MQDASDAVDDYLTHTYGIGLEQVIADATQGLVSLTLAGTVRLAAGERIAVFAHPDGGHSEIHQGVLSIAGVQYRFRCAIFIDAGRKRFVSDITEFEPIGWTLRVAVHGTPHSWR